MGVVATRYRGAEWCAFFAYAAVVAITAAHHEPWADEAHSWLLARDSGPVELWTRLLHYEGTAGLWQTLLNVVIRAGVPYRGMGAISGALGAAAAWLLIRRSPLPAPVRLLLPFTFFLCYQYAVVARSYAMLPPLLFAAALFYPEAAYRPWRLTAVLCLMAAVSVHGLAISGCIAMTVPALRRNLRAGAVYILVVALVAAAAWPAADGTFVTRPNFALGHFFESSGRMFRQAFTGEGISTAVVVLLSVPFLWRGRGLLPFALAAALLCAIGAILYAQVWHHGLLFLAWVFAVWVAGLRTRTDPAVLAALAAIIVIQGYWTVQSVRYDCERRYSASIDAARYLRENGIVQRKLYAIGYSCTALQPYFRRNIFANIRQGRGPAYWDWSNRNHTNEDSGRLAELRPDYVLVGYKGTYEQELWTRQVLGAGYLLVKHFEGNCYWKDRILEPESYDLYRRPGQP